MIYFHFRDAAYLRPQSEDKYSNKKLIPHGKRRNFSFLVRNRTKKPTSKMLVGYNTSSRPFLKTRFARLLPKGRKK